jgi:hypothetical protein
MNLLERLREHVGNDRELEAVLRHASGGGTRLLPQGKAEFQTPPPNVAVYATVKFRRGRISHLEPGPALSPFGAQASLIDRARVEAAHVHGYKVVQRVLLAERELTGSYRWKDRLRIDPCPDGAPIGEGLNWAGGENFTGFGDAPNGPPYPFILQVRIPRSPNPWIEVGRTNGDLDTYQNLLGVLVSGHIRTFAPSGARGWTLVRRNGALENHLLHPGFATGDEGRLPEFDSTIAANAPTFHGDDYYNYFWSQDPHITIPSSLALDLDTFESLEHEDADAFRRATYWYSIGLRNRMESAIATVAFSVSIECLLPKVKRPRCIVCHSEVGPGPTQLFKSHLARYGTVPEGLHSQRAQLYDVRSQLIHGSFAGSVDADVFSIAGDTFRHDLLLETVARRSLIHWLRDPRRRDWSGELPPASESASS